MLADAFTLSAHDAGGGRSRICEAGFEAALCAGARVETMASSWVMRARMACRMDVFESMARFMAARSSATKVGGGEELEVSMPVGVESLAGRGGAEDAESEERASPGAASPRPTSSLA